MAADKISIDLSEFLLKPWKDFECDDSVILKGIQEHMQQLSSCTEIEEVKLLGPTGFYLPGIEEMNYRYQFSRIFYPSQCLLTLQILVDALKAIFPEGGQQCTIERVELPYQDNIWLKDSTAEHPSNVKGPRLTVNNLCLYDSLFSDNEIYVQEDGLAAQLDVLRNLGVDVQHTVVVFVYQPGSYPPEAEDIHVPEGIQVEHKTHDLLEHCHISYVTATSRLCNHFTYTGAIPPSVHSKPELFKYLFVQQLKLNQIHKEKSKGGGVAVAVLASGYDYNSSSKWNIVDRHNSNSQYFPVHEFYGGVGSILTNILSQIAPEAKLIVCRTSFDRLRHLYPNSTTSRALNWLRGKWKAQEWGEDVHSLVVLIPYGGHYREDEMRAINDAIDDGIIVVCAAGSTISQSHGDHVPGIAFPASMGNVLCVGAMDDRNEPAFDSPSGREIDCVAVGSHESRFSDNVVVGTGISAAILSGTVALILGYIKSSLSAIPGGCPEHNHVSIIREVLQQTTTSTKHHPHSGYGLLTNSIFSFSQRQLEKLLNSITHERNVRAIPGSASDMTEECKFNSQILSNSELNSELEPISLDGGGIRVAVIDDDFPKILKTNYKAEKLQKEMDSWDKCTPAMSEDAKLLKQTAESLKKLASDLEGMIPSMIKLRTLEKEIATVEEKIDHIKNEIHSTYTPIKDSHGLQCALVVANTAPNAHLLLINTPQHPTSEDLAVEVEKLVEQ